jgi:eukaryotic-like serine/threonine-protein kinase
MFDEIAAGGMAAVHLGRLLAEAGFSRTVAIKRLHPQLARDPDFVTMFLDEARLASRIRHPNVVQTLDIVTENDEVLLVMEYVAGESLSRLVRAARPSTMPLRIAVAVMTAVLHGLHAAHEAKTEQGAPLELVHRDVSPQNILVGTDGIARVLDFGVAKASQRAQTTKEGQIKGKLSYMAPEVLRRDQFDRRTDIYAAAVVLWEAITGQRLFEAETEARVVMKVLDAEVRPPSAVNPDVPSSLDEVVMRGLAREPDDRWATAREMAIALERCGVAAAASSEISEWVEGIAAESLGAKAARVAEIERSSDQGIPASPSSSRLLGSRSGPFSIVDPSLPPGDSSLHTQVATSATLTGREGAGGRITAVLATLAVVGLGLGGYALFVRQAQHATASGAPPQAVTTPVVVPAESPPLEPSKVPAPPQTATADVSAAPPPTEAKKPSAHAAGRAKPAAALPVPKPAAKPDACKVPYTIDSSGIRHLKPECL